MVFSASARKVKVKSAVVRDLSLIPSNGIKILLEFIIETRGLRGLLGVMESDLTGKILKNQYKIIRQLQGGGFGNIYVAQDINASIETEYIIKQFKLSCSKIASQFQVRPSL